jgi:tetratricopeptide (TPR) repeat protein
VLCHDDWSTEDADRAVRAGWGEPKPLHPAVAALVAGGGEPGPAHAERALLTGGDDHPAARYRALAILFEQRFQLDAPITGALGTRVRELARDADVETAALALAALHLTAGSHADTRRLLAAALDGQPDEARLRARWSTALAFRAERLRAGAAPGAAGAVLARALEIAPDDAGLHEQVGLAHADAGRFDAAARAYEHSLALDPRRPLTLVNLGVARGQLGDAAGAAAAWERALAVDPGEPLAWYNLGNARLRAGDYARAATAYRNAAIGDPTLAAAHFSLARALAVMGDFDAARAAADDGLAIAPHDDAGRRLRADIDDAIRASPRAPAADPGTP